MKIDETMIINSPVEISGALIKKDGQWIRNRVDLVMEAIKDFQQNGFEKIKSEYYGFKNYAHFGDQRCDCSYGTIPRHGSIVFSIELVNKSAENESMIKCGIYYLLKSIEFGGVYNKDGKYFSLGNLIDEKFKIMGRIDEIDSHINSAESDQEIEELIKLQSPAGL